MLLVKYQQMPKPLRSLVMTEAKAMSEDVIDKTNIKITSDTTQKYILDSCLIEIMERDYSGNN